MTTPQAITSQLEALLRLAGTIRKDHEVAKARSQDISKDVGYPKDLHGYVQQVKGLVGDWDSQQAAQTYFPAAKASMQALFDREISGFPTRLTQDEANILVSSIVNPVPNAQAAEDAQSAVLEIRRFWAELTQTKELLDLRLLGIKYNLQ